MLDKVYSKNEDIVSRRIADEFILVPIRKKTGDMESIYTLNEVATRIWELIDGKCSLKHIEQIMTEDFEVNPQELEKDLQELLQQLEKIGAVKEV
jgi:hypothetical protein